MINLIPPQARKGVVTEYWVRVASVWMFTAGTALVCVAVLYSPVYLLFQLQLNAFAETFAEASVTAESFEQGERSVREANDLSALLLTTEELSLVKIIESLEAFSGDGVDVRGIEIKKEAGSIDSVLLSGLASTRSELNDYRNRIEADEMFSDVVLPLSNLAKEEDITFNITVTMTKGDEN